MTLTSCACCSGISVATPHAIDNRPGLSAIAYRIGTHPEFKSSLLARLSKLPGLRTRDDGDFTIGLLDAFATMADVLTFYQERIANESYLRTATERRSLLELARLIGYELDPGVASTVYLAFTVEDAPGAFGRALSVTTTMPTAPEVPPPVTVPARTKLQTIPGPGELPQMFETIEPLDARAIWNAMTPRRTRPQVLDVKMERLWLAGTTQQLKKGDRLLISVGGKQALRTVKRVTAFPSDERMLAELEPFVAQSIAEQQKEKEKLGPNENQKDEPPPQKKKKANVSGQALDVGMIEAIASMSFTEEELQTFVQAKGWDRDVVSNAVSNAASASVTSAPDDEGVWVFRQRASIFGYNAPSLDPKTIAPKVATWDNDTLETHADKIGTRRHVHLDRVYDEVLTDTWIALESAGGTDEILPIAKVDHVARAQSMISGRSTRIGVIAGSLSDFKVRETTALVQSESLVLAQVPIETAIDGAEIELDADYPWLTRGRVIAITGARYDLPSEVVSEIRVLEEVRLAQGFTKLTVDPPLKHRYLRATLVINANVAFATHGETVSEILGAGDATQPFQRFKLKQPPLTYIGADNETGSVSTLEVRVNDVLWREVESLYGHRPDERIYTIRNEDDGSSHVLFGDGESGARLPTGTNNIAAVYRRGIGTSGNARASQIATMMNKPVGVKGATNPLPASGAGDPETLADARLNASLTALTLGRVVSLRDYEDFARAYPGIAKATASWSWSGERRHILLTVAGDGGATIAPDSDLAKRLTSAIRKLGDAQVAMSLASYVPLTFRIKARVKLDPAYLPDKVFASIRQTLRDEFSFAARSFSQSVSRAEVLAVMHRSEGVIAVDLDQFYSNEGKATDNVARIGAHPKTRTGPARLLTIDPINEIKLEVMP
jgi:predicted phage baseplate assembly protein